MDVTISNAALQLPAISSRRVTQAPQELAPTCGLSLRQTCLVCGTANLYPHSSSRCNYCKEDRLFCSSECRRLGRATHKSDGTCDQIAALFRKYEYANTRCLDSQSARQKWYQSHFPGEFNGRNFDQLLCGRMSEDPYKRPVLDSHFDVALSLAHHPTSVYKVERLSLRSLMHLKCQTYLADPYNLDACIASVLLKLYREDDAVGVILYWLDWRSRGPNLDHLRDNRIENRFADDWPIPVVADARLLDISGNLRSFPEQDAGVSVPIEFALTALVIQVRFITVYLARAAATTLFLNAAGFYRLTNEEDTQSHIVSFLVEGGRERYEMQRTHANRLMEYIDERDAAMLPALLDPSIRQGNDEDGQQVNLETFLDTYANGQPVVSTLKSMLAERYEKKKSGTSC